MHQPHMIRVKAVSGNFPLVDDAGRTVMGRYVGRDRDGHALPNGELVPDNAYYRAGLRDGSLELLEEGGED